MTKENESRLLSCKSLPEFVTMFFGLGMHEKLSIFSEEITIPKGTHFFRIRRIEGIKDADDPKEWGPVPKELAKQGRFNGAFESVLYVASSTDMLEREVRLKEGEEYYLAKYVCNTAFKVGSFLGVNNQVNTLIHKIAMAVSESEDLTAEENALIDEYYKTAKGMNLFDLSLDPLASLYIHKMLPRLYDMTNKFAKLILKKNEFGIRYSSVYAPIELSGAPVILTLAGTEYGNYVLTQKGYEQITLVSAEKKVCGKTKGLELVIETFSKGKEPT